MSVQDVQPEQTSPPGTTPGISAPLVFRALPRSPPNPELLQLAAAPAKSGSVRRGGAPGRGAAGGGESHWWRRPGPVGVVSPPSPRAFFPSLPGGCPRAESEPMSWGAAGPGAWWAGAWVGGVGMERASQNPGLEEGAEGPERGRFST